MKAIARSLVYWAGIDYEIEDCVKHCVPCSTASRASTKTTLLEISPIPSIHWSRTHFDYAYPVDGACFLIVEYPYIKWPGVYVTKSTSTKIIIKMLNLQVPAFQR